MPEQFFGEYALNSRNILVDDTGLFTWGLKRYIDELRYFTNFAHEGN